MTEEEGRSTLNEVFERECLRIADTFPRPEIDPALILSVLEVCKVHPALAVQRYSYRQACALRRSPNCITPLEYYILRKTPLHDIREFCQLFPNALAVPSALDHVDTASGGLPLHLACANFPTSSENLVGYLALAYPEGVSTRDDRGNLPLHLLLLHLRPIDIQEELALAIDTLLELYPDTLTQTDHSKRITPISRVLSQPVPLLIMKVFAKHMKQLSTLSLQLSVQSFTHGANILLTSLTDSTSKLKKLQLELDWNSFRDRPEHVATIQAFIPECTRVTSLIISFFESPTHVRIPAIDASRVDNSICPLAEPIADLMYSGNLIELIIKKGSRGLELDPEPILQAIANHPDSVLETLDVRCFGTTQGNNMTQLISDAIASNSNLRSLAVSNITMSQREPIFRALAGNTHLKTLVLPNIIAPPKSNNDDSKDGDDYEKLSTVMRKDNISLQQVRCYGATFDDMRGAEYEAIQYYALLNRCGRRETRREAFTSADLVKLLMSLNYRDAKMLGCTFGLLLECPSTWSSSSL